MPFRDLREFIARLEKEGEAQRIKEEVNWDLEAGAMLRRSYECRLPAPFFEKLTGYSPEYRLFGGTLSTFKRVAIALDLPPDTSQERLMEEYLTRRQRRVKPVIVKEGPCKENIHTGRDVDVLEFPVPVVHEGDGGRYIGTFHLVASKDPGSDWTNWGMYRLMVQNKNTLGRLTLGFTHLNMMWKKYEAMKKPMPVAIAIGVEPVSTWCAATAIPYGVSEVDVAGGLRGAPVELIKCETSDILVPASAEIVLEGEISAEEMMEGPFGEFAGYVVGPREPRGTIKIKAITHRNSPILSMSCVGVPVDENDIIFSLSKGSEVLEALRQHGIPVKAVNVPPESCGLMAVVSVDTRYSHMAEQVSNVCWGSRAGQNIPYVVVVNNDANVFNLSEIIHNIASKCHPHRGIMTRDRSMGNPLLPFLSAHERTHNIGARACFDCTWPLDWAPSDVPRKASFECIYPANVQKSALEKWRKYGY